MKVLLRRLILMLMLLSWFVSFDAVCYAQGPLHNVDVTLVDAQAFPVVKLYASASMAEGTPITSLSMDDFEVYEDDIPISTVTVETVDHPLLLGIVIDSASTFNTWEGGKPRVDHAKEVAGWLVNPQQGRLMPDDEVQIFAFREGEAEQLLADFTYDHQKALDAGVVAVSTEGNQYTALLDLVRKSVAQTAVRLGARRRIMLIFSDGVDKTSGADLDAVIKQAQQADLVIHTVGLGPGLQADGPASALLRNLAEETGGQYLWYRPGFANSEDEMRGFLDALVEQRTGYMVSFVSNQYQGLHDVRLIATQGSIAVEATASFEIPPLPPVITLDYPADGDIVEGLVMLEPGLARSQRDLDRVEYYVDDRLIFAARAAPWAYSWDTSEYASSITDYEEHTLSVVACDMGNQCSDPVVKTLGTRLVPPTPTPLPPPTPETIIITPPGGDPEDVVTVLGYTLRVSTLLSIASLLVALIAVGILVVYMKRGGGQAVGNVVREVRRKTQVFMNSTKIFGKGGGALTPTLSVISGEKQGQVFKIENRVLYLGRDDERADLVFEWDDFISRRHAKLSQENGEWFLWDLGSSNKTWHNDVLVRASLSEGTDMSEAVVLTDGDIIRLGPNLKLRFHLPSKGGGAQEVRVQQPGAVTQTMDQQRSAAGSPSARGGNGVEDTAVFARNTASSGVGSGDGSDEAHTQILSRGER